MFIRPYGHPKYRSRYPIGRNFHGNGSWSGEHDTEVSLKLPA
jgi:hypothetical protein